MLKIKSTKTSIEFMMNFLKKELINMKNYQELQIKKKEVNFSKNSKTQLQTVD